MQIGEICHRDVIRIGKEASVLAAAQAMREHHVGDVIVTELASGIDKPIGIVTDRDIVVELLAKEVDPRTVTVGDVMSLTMVTAKHDADIFETLRFMDIKGVRRLPVLDQSGALFGILSIDDFLGVLTKELSFLADLSQRQIERERTTRE